MTTNSVALRIALAQAASFGLSPAPGINWITHEDLEAAPGQGATREKSPLPAVGPARTPD